MCFFFRIAAKHCRQCLLYKAVFMVLFSVVFRCVKYNKVHFKATLLLAKHPQDPIKIQVSNIKEEDEASVVAQHEDDPAKTLLSFSC